MSPLLFIVFMNKLDKKKLEDERVLVVGGNVNSLLFADDLVLPSSSKQKLQALNCVAAGG